METWPNNYFYDLPNELQDLVFEAVQKILKEDVQRELLNKTDWNDYTKFTKTRGPDGRPSPYMYTYSRKSPAYPGFCTRKFPTKAELVQYLRDNRQPIKTSWKKLKLKNALMKF